MSIKKRPVSPRQKMINLMYIVLLAMLALNVSNEVLKGFDLVGESLARTKATQTTENENLYRTFREQMDANPTKVRPWYEQAMKVKAWSDSLYNLTETLRWEIARAADGSDGNPDSLDNREDLDAAGRVMLSPMTEKGRDLKARIDSYRQRMLAMVSDPRLSAIIAANLTTELPRRLSADDAGKNWQEYMFEAMPAIAAVTMLDKLQSDVRKAEGEVLRSLATNIDVNDIRVNELNAYVLADATTLYPGETFRSRIVMAAVDTTMRPEIYVNGTRIDGNGNYTFPVGGPGEYTLQGFIRLPNAAGDIIERPFTQRYNVIPTPTGATVAADLMNVLYAGYNNPMSISASGIPEDKIKVTMSGGTLTPQGKGKYIARPAAVGQDATFTVTGVVNGKPQTMGTFAFKVRKLPDPTAYIMVGADRVKGGKVSKQALLGLKELHAAIDDGLLDINFRVTGFECLFFDRIGNARPERSAGSAFTGAQRSLISELRRGQRLFITNVQVIGPDGIQRTLPQAMQLIVN